MGRFTERSRFCWWYVAEFSFVHEIERGEQFDRFTQNEAISWALSRERVRQVAEETQQNVSIFRALWAKQEGLIRQ